MTATCLLIFILNIVSANEAWRTSIEGPEVEALHQKIETSLTDNQVIPNGQVGIYAKNLKTGQFVSLNENDLFFMASTYKVAIAVRLLHLVDIGQVSLDEKFLVKPENIVPGSGVLASHFSEIPVTLSVSGLLKLMMQYSDNTATDILLQLAGGPEAVQSDISDRLQIKDMRINRSTMQFFADVFNIQLPVAQSTLDKLMAMAMEKTPMSGEEFLRDTRDNASPLAMGNLLTAIYEGKAISSTSQQMLLTIMSKRHPETGRLYKELPENMWVVQKLGTSDVVMNDVGLVKLPDDKGVVVIVIFMKNVDTPKLDEKDFTAHLAKTLVDFFINIQKESNE